MNLSLRAINRFWSKVEYTDTCWAWGSTKDACGYGRLGIMDNGKFKYLSAHRISYFLHFGEIPKDLCVIHSCDVRHCVNPKHLRLGTHNDNMQDMYSKGRRRAPVGSKNPRAIVTEELVKQIRNEYVPKYGNLTKIAKKYGLSVSAMGLLINKTNWSSV